MNTREKIVSIINKFDGLKSTSTRSVLVFLVLLAIVLLVSALSILVDIRVGDATLSSISSATIEAYRYGQPVKTRRQALIAVQQEIMYSHVNLLVLLRLLLLERCVLPRLKNVSVRLAMKAIPTGSARIGQSGWLFSALNTPSLGQWGWKHLALMVVYTGLLTPRMARGCKPAAGLARIMAYLIEQSGATCDHCYFSMSAVRLDMHILSRLVAQNHSFPRNL